MNIWTSKNIGRWAWQLEKVESAGALLARSRLLCSSLCPSASALEVFWVIIITVWPFPSSLCDLFYHHHLCLHLHLGCGRSSIHIIIMSSSSLPSPCKRLIPSSTVYSLYFGFQVKAWSLLLCLSVVSTCNCSQKGSLSVCVFALLSPYPIDPSKTHLVPFIVFVFF